MTACRKLLRSVRDYLDYDSNPANRDDEDFGLRILKNGRAGGI